MKLLSAGLILATCADASPAARDLQRAKTKIPRRAYIGSSFANGNAKLNAALERSSAAPMLAACSELSMDQLQATMSALIQATDRELHNIYESTGDARVLRHSADGYEQEWNSLGQVANTPKLAAAAHDMMCHEAVMLFVHHLTETKRAALVTEGTLQLPKLPVGERIFSNDVVHAEENIVMDAYLKATGCVACHTDIDGLKPDMPVSVDAPKWPPAAEPVIPWRWSASLGGWMDRDGGRTDFTGTFHYDYALNRMKEHWVVTGYGMEIINYWFGAPGPDGEDVKNLPEGAQRGHVYQVTTMGGQMLSCRDDTYAIFSIVRPDAFIKQWHNDAENLHYVARENMDTMDMGGATGWADHWTYADTCGNFSLWNSIESGLPVYTRGPTGCNSGNAGNSYVNHTLAPPEESLFQFNFSTCQPGQASEQRSLLWGSAAVAQELSLV